MSMLPSWENVMVMSQLALNILCHVFDVNLYDHTPQQNQCTVCLCHSQWCNTMIIALYVL